MHQHGPIRCMSCAMCSGMKPHAWPGSRDMRVLVWDVETSDLRPQTSDLRPQTSDLRGLPIMYMCSEKP